MYNLNRPVDPVQLLKQLLSPCKLCPRQCNAMRTEGKTGFCGIGSELVVASWGPHHGEEDCLRGWAGSGTIFLAGCNLGCLFCQNWEISHLRVGKSISPDKLASIMLRLQSMGCHNINWVTPTHVIPMLIEALIIARNQGLTLPVVYNCGGYESVETLRLLEGYIDIYMPDFKFWEMETAAMLAKAPNYPEVAKLAIKEMHRQVGDLQLDQNGLARRGLLIRHLVMPGFLTETKYILKWIAEEISPNTYVNIMAQYYPAGYVSTDQFPSPYNELLKRRLKHEEYVFALKAAKEAGLRRLDQRWISF